MKLLIVGADGADFFVMKGFLDQLPALREFPCFGRLQSTDFPTSPAAWCSAYSGCKPEKHGIEGFRKDGAKTMRVLPFWNHLNCKIGLVNLPCVYGGMVEDNFRGFVIPGFSALMEVYPDRLKLNRWIVDTTQHQKGRLRWLLRGKDRLTTGVKEAQIKFLEFNRNVERRHVNEAIRLARLFDVDILFIGLMILDRVGHGFAHHEATMLDCYRTVDKQIGKMVSALNPESAIVFSDHGMDIASSDRISETVRQNEVKALRKNPNKLNAKGLHTLDGVFLARGSDIWECQPEGKIWDVAPTALRILGVPKPDYMSGRVMDIFRALSESEEEELLESLRALGYV